MAELGCHRQTEAIKEGPKTRSHWPQTKFPEDIIAAEEIEQVANNEPAGEGPGRVQARASQDCINKPRTPMRVGKSYGCRPWVEKRGIQEAFPNTAKRLVKMLQDIEIEP